LGAALLFRSLYYNLLLGRYCISIAIFESLFTSFWFWIYGDKVHNCSWCTWSHN